MATIVFNANTGSDTDASGAPADFGPINGNNASVTNGSAVVNLSADNPDLTNVPIDESATIWFQTTTGRNNYVIYNKNITNKEVHIIPVAEIPTGTYRWAIGGKRRTFEDAYSRKTLAHIERNVVYTETDQVINSTLIAGEPGSYALNFRPWFGGAPDGGKKRLTITADAHAIEQNSAQGYITIKNLIIRCTSVTKTNCRAIAKPKANLINCQIGEALDGSDSFTIGCESPILVQDCAFIKCLDKGIDFITSPEGQRLENVFIYGCGNIGCIIRPTSYGVTINNVIITQCGSHGMSFPIGVNATFVIYNCIFSENSGSGIFCAASTSGLRYRNCIFARNGRYGVEYNGTWSPYAYTVADMMGYSCFWQNTMGARLNVPPFEGDVAVDPQFKDPANFNFEVGPNLKQMGWPTWQKTLGAQITNTRSYVDIGAAQRKEPSFRSAKTVSIPALTTA